MSERIMVESRKPKVKGHRKDRLLALDLRPFGFAQGKPLTFDTCTRGSHEHGR